MAEALVDTTGAATEQDAADALGWSASTVRTVRNRTNTLSLELLARAVRRTDGRFLGPFLARFGLRAVPISSVATADHDKLLRLSRALTALAELAPDGLTDDDLENKFAEFEAGKEVLFELCNRVHARRARLRVAA